jgi:hypothetical protein
VPEAFISLLQGLGAEVQRMPAGQSLRQKLCWRFLVTNDPGIGRFIVRDCDSVVNQREVRAVEQWLVSDRWFHVMRDWWTHTDPILAGLWGGISGVLPDLQTLLAAYTPTALETANVDQWFLRDVLWGSIRHHALIHDRCYRSEGSQPWPDADPSANVHVGQDEFAVRRSHAAAVLGVADAAAAGVPRLRGAGARAAERVGVRGAGSAGVWARRRRRLRAAAGRLPRLRLRPVLRIR